MKKNIIKTVATLTAMFFVLSCKKDNPQAEDFAIQPQVAATSITGSGTYLTCNSTVNIFTPNLSMEYILYMEKGGSFVKFGIPDLGILDFQNIDKIKFEFSGLYADRANTVKLYRIRRTDGKYLTFWLAAGYFNKLQGFEEQYQLWIVNNLGSNKYNLMIPRTDPCYTLRTYFDDPTNSYRIGFVASGQTTFVGSKTIQMLPVNVLPPVTK